jgi:hypothetical protein
MTCDEYLNFGISLFSGVRHQKISNEWNVVVDKIRQTEGFSSFLRPIPFEQLQQSAVNGPIVIINISAYRSDAIIVTSRSPPRLVSLSKVTASIVESLSQDLRTALKADPLEQQKEIAELLEQLWNDIVCPIVDELNIIRAETSNSYPKRKTRIWFCPTSFAWLLPLHAAGEYKRGGRTLYNSSYICSYTPTLSALLRSLNPRKPRTENFWSSHNPIHLAKRCSHPSMMK